jgi:hypothetical protein
MNKKPLNIDDLLKALKNPDTIDDDVKAEKGSLANTIDTWHRIGAKDATLATDIGIDESELNDFLKEWVEDNPYNDIN